MIGALGFKVFSPKRMPVDVKGFNEPVLHMERSGAKASDLMALGFLRIVLLQRQRLKAVRK